MTDVRHGHAYYLEMAEAKFYTVYRMPSNYMQKTLDTLQHSTILANFCMCVSSLLPCILIHICLHLLANEINYFFYLA